MDLPSLKRETRYGMPAADQVMFNRYFVTGYSYYFRQPKWALEIVDPGRPDAKKADFDRLDNFRADLRVPEMFRAELKDYKGSGFDRGHLVASANQDDTRLQNSETFLLSNMSPQKPTFNRGIWKKLESEVRRLNKMKSTFETYVICGPMFDFQVPVKSIGTDDANDVSVPIPHYYFKSVLAEKSTGALHMWSFVLPNEPSDEPLSSFRIPTTDVENWAGIELWDRLKGDKIEKEKNRVRKMW